MLLVTGAMGHVGYELVSQAASRGVPVVAQYRGTFRAADAEVLKGVVWVRSHLNDPAALEGILGQHPITGCIHTAAVPNESIARSDPLGTVDSNVRAVALLLEHARTAGWRRFVHVSTGSVFQNAADVSTPILEDAPPSVSNVYSTTKLAGELLVAMYRSQYGLSAATVRISWVYGPPLVPKVRDNPRGPIPYFLRCALSGQPIGEPGGGDFAASFTHVSDVAAGLLAAFEAGELRHPVYHLGSGRNQTTRDVARAVQAAVPGAACEVGPGTAPWTDHTRMRGPLAGDRLYEDTGFRPSLSLEEGVSAFAQWMKANRERWQ